MGATRHITEKYEHLDLENKNVLDPILRKCRKGNNAAQKALFRLLYPYGMSICLRYTQNQSQAKEVLNDGFLKIFAKLGQLQPGGSFKAWARRIFVNTAIDHYRKYKRYQHTLEITQVHTEFVKPEAIDQLAVEDLLKMINQLSPGYRLIFNLYAIEGYSHKEISEKLNISEGTSKSNLFKARMRLKKMIEEVAVKNHTYYG